MDERDRAEFMGLVEGLGVTFRTPVTKPLLSGYWAGLSDLPFGDVSRSCERALRECKFMPTPRELRDLAPRPPPLAVVNPAMERLLAPFLRQEEWPDKATAPAVSESILACLRNADEAALNERRARKAYSTSAPGSKELNDARYDVGRYTAEKNHWLEYAEWYRKQQGKAPAVPIRSSAPPPAWLASKPEKETDMERSIRQRVLDMSGGK